MSKDFPITNIGLQDILTQPFWQSKTQKNAINLLMVRLGFAISSQRLNFWMTFRNRLAVKLNLVDGVVPPNAV